MEGLRAGAPIIELVRQGGWLRVSAICPATGQEACAVGPSHATAALRQLALQRLSLLRARGAAGGQAR
ncbi:MAG: hypothetical protein IT556_02940 [Acetobacteraceae bacterium]|nr:hypothetical protein [Acetobacteraceae bacterium]